MLDELWAIMSGQLGNEIFSGGLALGLIGVGAALVGRYGGQVLTLAKRRMIVSIEVDNQSEVFEWLAQWFNEHPYIVSCRRLKAERGWDSEERLQLYFSPARGLHLLWHDGRPILIERELEESKATRMSGPLERFIVWSFGGTSQTLKNILVDAMGRYGMPDGDCIKVYSHDADSQTWRLLQKKRKRPINSVVLPNGTAEKLLNDAHAYLESRDWYVSRGLPWRRGYLLYGAPGTGKSSLVMALASELEFNVCIVNLGATELDDVALCNLMAEAPYNSILLFEDIDAVFNGRRSEKRSSRITFSGLLNSIDGVAAQEGGLIIMTTNHVDRLDPALIRPGRVDKKLEFTLASTDQLREMFLRFFPRKYVQANEFSMLVPDYAVSPAHIQAYLLCHASDPNAAMQDTHQLLVDHSENEFVGVYMATRTEGLAETTSKSA